MNSKPLVLVVDDSPLNLDIIVDHLPDTYDIAIATNGIQALEFFKTEVPDIVLLDVIMPEMDGYEACKRIKASYDVPIIFITTISDISSKVKSFELGAVDYIEKPFEIAELKARVKTHLDLKLTKDRITNYSTILEREVKKRTEDLLFSRTASTINLSVLAEFRDNDSGHHIIKTSKYLKELVMELIKQEQYGEILTAYFTENLCQAAPLHDIGKIGISDLILLKPGKLDDQEYEKMKNHTLIGFNALNCSVDDPNSNFFMRIAAEIAYYHHERWDGKGYPLGLSGDNIPLSARLMAIVDVYDALTSKRVYKEAFSHVFALETIKNEHGKAFDPILVDVFLSIGDKIQDIQQMALSDDIIKEYKELIFGHYTASTIHSK